MYIKCRFLKDSQPKGREYTYFTDDSNPVSIGDIVSLPNGKGIVTAVNVPEEEIAGFKDKVKAIVGKAEEGEVKND